MLKVVIDANVWISAITTSWHCRSILAAFKQDLFSVFYPPWLLHELSDVLSRPKFENRVRPDDISRLLELIKAKATVIAISTEQVLPVSQDPKDNVYLACARAADCDLLVTGDKRHLLCLIAYGRTQIIPPAQFLEILRTPDKRA